MYRSLFCVKRRVEVSVVFGEMVGEYGGGYDTYDDFIVI